MALHPKVKSQNSVTDTQLLERRISGDLGKKLLLER